MTEATPTAAGEGPRGIGGWLILPAFGISISPIWIVVSLIRDVLPALEPQVWNALTTPGSNVYHPSFAPLIVFETVGNILLLMFSLYVAYRFWTKSRKAPGLMIIWLVGSLLLIVVDTFWSLQIPVVAKEAGSDYFKDLARAAIGTVIWVPYFAMSKRVKNTFVE